MSRTFQLLLLLLLVGIARADDIYKNITDGLHSCGGVDIPYPFGIHDQDGNGSFRHGFGLACKDGKPLLSTAAGHLSFPIGNFSIKSAEARLWLPVAWQCYNSSGERNGSAQHKIVRFHDESVYRISNAGNYLLVLSCGGMGYLRSKPLPDAVNSNSTDYAELSSCVGYCNDDHSAVNGVCSGVGCCHTDIPPDLVDNSVHFERFIDSNNSINFSACDYGFLVEKDYYTFHTDDLNMDLHLTPRLMPVTIDWAIRDNLTCTEARGKDGYACISSSSRCLNSTNGPGYICSCQRGYEGNPYIRDGCTDIDECQIHNPCKGVCRNKQGSYECTCEKNSHSDNPYKEPCSPNLPLKAKSKITIGTGVSGVVIIIIILIIVFFWMLSKEKIKMKQHFEKNGGPILEKLNNIKLFTKEDIQKIIKTSKFIEN